MYWPTAPACCLLLIILMGPPAHAQMSVIEREIADYDREIQQTRELADLKKKISAPLDDEINKKQAHMGELERQLGPLNIELEGLRRNTLKAKTLLETALSNPELVDSQKLETLHRDHRSAVVRQGDKENEASIISKELEVNRSSLKDLQAKRRGLLLEAEVLKRGIQTLTIRKPVIVETDGECFMHEDITPRACKEQALLKAKQNAIETGGTSLVRSLTEVRMNDLVRDETSVRTLAKIRHMDVLQPATLMPHGELGKYRVKIRAAVQSQMSEMAHTLEKPAEQAASSRPASTPMSLEPPPSAPSFNPVSAFNMSYNDYLNGKYDLAISGFQRFLRDFPGTSLTPNAYYWLGESYYQQRNLAPARESLEYLLRAHPSTEKAAAALYKLGVIAEESGDLYQSRKQFKKVIEEFPVSDEAKLAKARLAKVRY